MQLEQTARKPRGAQILLWPVCVYVCVFLCGEVFCVAFFPPFTRVVYKLLFGIDEAKAARFGEIISRAGSVPRTDCWEEAQVVQTGLDTPGTLLQLSRLVAHTPSWRTARGKASVGVPNPRACIELRNRRARDASLLMNEMCLWSLETIIDKSKALQYYSPPTN
jgi:hypothetical protein